MTPLALSRGTHGCYCTLRTTALSLTQVLKQQGFLSKQILILDVLYLTLHNSKSRKTLFRFQFQIYQREKRPNYFFVLNDLSKVRIPLIFFIDALTLPPSLSRTLFHSPLSLSLSHTHTDILCLFLSHTLFLPTLLSLSLSLSLSLFLMWPKLFVLLM